MSLIHCEKFLTDLFSAGLSVDLLNQSSLFICDEGRKRLQQAPIKTNKQTKTQKKKPLEAVMAVPKKISADCALAAVLSELDSIFRIK